MTVVMNDLLKTENLISIKVLSEKLSISEATVKNWVKLNKIKPSIIKNNKIFFYKEYAEELYNSLNSKNSALLKSRRNKKYVSGNFYYNDYIPVNSKNINTIKALLSYIQIKEYSFSKQEIMYIIADCALQLFTQNKKLTNVFQNNCLYEYLKNNISIDFYSVLIDDLIDNKTNAILFIKKHPDVFRKYVYEQSIDILGLLYISLVNLKNRKLGGAYYTPTKIVKKIIAQICFNKFENKTIVDPCCGTGNFLLQLPTNINIEQIFGNDIDENAIHITRLNMALKFEIKNIDVLYKNFTNNNFLLNCSDAKYDYIVGNPPWGAEFKPNMIDRLRVKYLSAQTKNIESYDVFIEKALSSLKEKGYLLFVIPEAILTVKNHEIIRQIILSKTTIKSIEFLGNIFDKVQCPSIILNIHYTNKPFSSIGMQVTIKNKKFIINTDRQVKSDIFDFLTDDAEYLIYKKLLNPLNKVYLKNNSIFALGIVTGNNQKYLTKKKTSSNEIVLKGCNIKKYKIKGADNYIEFKPNEFQQTAPVKIYRYKEKLLYRFISKKLIFAYDDEQTLSLNSCNILIPKIDNLNIKYIMAVLNSQVAQFIFQKKYNSVKVLRTHLEEIPIPNCNNNTQTEIVNIVDKIIKGDDSDFDVFYNILEEKIYKLYDLSSDEYKKIVGCNC